MHVYNNTVNSFIFRKKINSDYKLVPFKVSVYDIGIMKYLPPVAKEWKNSVYNYNSNNFVNYPVYDLKINSLIKSYFNLYFTHKFLKHKYISRKKKSRSFNKIYVSKAEIKHTNSKAIITIYVYNRERFILLNKWQELLEELQQNIRDQAVRKGRLGRKKEIDEILAKFMFLSVIKNKLRKFFSYASDTKQPFIQSKNFTKDSAHPAYPKDTQGATNRRPRDADSLWRLDNSKQNDNYIINSILYNRMKRLAKLLYRILGIIRRYRLRISLNKYKFEEVFLYRLSKLISKYYAKKVEFNIVNLKSIPLNGDIFTEILTKKLKNPRRNPTVGLNSLFDKIILPNLNRIIRDRIENTIDLELLIGNKYKNPNLSSILHNNNSFNYSLNKLLYNIYYKNTDKKVSKLTVLSNEDSAHPAWAGCDESSPCADSIRDIILDNIKYKSIGGVRLRVKGRLTRRYRADRAVFRMKWKGGLKNIDSAFKGLSTVTYRGFMDSNVEKSSSVSKRRIGAFGVTSWFAGKNYSTMANRPTNSNIYTPLHPGFITGFSDAESSFMVTIYKDDTRQIGWAIKLTFRIG